MNIVDDLQYLKETKNLIKQSIIDKGVEIEDDTTFRQYADKIDEISGGSTKKERFIKIGNLTNDNGVYSNFSNDNYICLKHLTFAYLSYGIPLDVHFEFNIGFKTPASFDSDYSIIGNTRNGAYLNDIFVGSNGRVCYWSGSQLSSGNLLLEPRTDYIVNYSRKNNSVYGRVSVIKDENYSLDTLPPISTWPDTYLVTSTNFSDPNSNILIGKNMVNQFYPAEIDMNKCNYIDHDVEVWRAIS